MAANKIKKLASAKAAYNLYRDRSVSITTKNNSSTGFLRNNKRTNNKDPKHNSNHRYCVFWKKSVIPEQKYMLYIAEDCFGKRYNQQTIKEGL